MSNEKGFTLIEIMAVLVIMSVIFAVAVKKVGQANTGAELVALEAGVSELNGQERLQFLMAQLNGGWQNDAAIFTTINTNLGSKYSWSALTIAGGILQFGSSSLELERLASTPVSNGQWKEK